jgi:hypothetical protein
MHVELLVEEPSCAEAIRILVPKIIGNQSSFDTRVFQGKQDLLASLPARLRGYARWLPSDWRIVVLIDRDGDDCHTLKSSLETMAKDAGLRTPTATHGTGAVKVVNRIAVEELEAWFFGDVEALAAAYPRIPPTLGAKRGFRDPDAISGGTWERLHRLLAAAGYYRGGMPKIEVARKISRVMDPARNRSRSFQVFCRALRELVA